MKAHLLTSEGRYCHKFRRCLKGDYEVLPLDRFKKVYAKQKSYCCKICLGYLKKEGEIKWPITKLTLKQ